MSIKFLESWPLDEDGKPMDLFSFTITEKIGLPNYSNVDVGPATIHRFVPDDANKRKEVVEDVEAIAREQREIILNIVKRQTK